MSSQIREVSLQEEAEKRYLNYALSVITSRALPDVRDGLKPVQRRILYAMYHQLKLLPNTKYRKSAAVVGETMGKFHPHGDQAIYDAMVRMAQDFSLLHPLVEGYGNFGSIDGDKAAAMRYCVTGDTLVHTPQGERRIADFVPATPNSTIEIDDTVLDRLARPVHVSRFFHSGDHPTLRIKTSEGFALTGSNNHPVLCLVEAMGVPMLLWKLMAEIKPGDWVAISRQQTPPSETVFSEEDYDLSFLAGAFVSEGWVGEKRAGFNNIDVDYFNRVIKAYDSIVGGARYLNSRPLASGRMINELDVHNLEALKASPLVEMVGYKSSDKRIPSFVWSAPIEAQRVFLQSLFEGDGSCSLLPRNTIQISYSTQSETLAEDVQRLLLSFGVIGRISVSSRDEYKVVLTNRRDARVFAERVGFWGQKQLKLEELLSQIPLSSRSLSQDHIPFLADYVRSEEPSVWLRKHNIDRVERWERDREKILSEIQSEEVKSVILPLVDAGYYYTQVAEVKETGEQPVYSLRVDSECHSFLTNGFVSHNTEARLQPLSIELLDELKQQTVELRPNFDGSSHEPVVLPSRVPQLLLNGSTGIAVGMATNIPPHNLTELIDALLLLLDLPESSTADILKRIKGPDFPTGGEVIASREDRISIYEKGQGNFIVRGEWKEEKIRGKGKKIKRVIITSTPYSVNRSTVVEKIAEVIVEKKVAQLLDIRDESTDQTRIVLELKANADPALVMAYLFKHTPLESRFSANLTCLVPTPNPLVAAPERLSLKQMLEQFLAFRYEVLERRFQFELKKLLDHIHILEGQEIIFNNLDEAIRLIRESNGRKDSKERLMARFGLTDRQAEAIVDLRLYRIAKLEIEDILRDLEKSRKKADEIRAILGSRTLMENVMRDEFHDIKSKYGVARKSRIREADKTPEIQADTFIQEEDTNVILTRDGWVKRIKTIKDVSTIRLRENDEILAILPGSTKEMVCFLTNFGVAYTCRIWDVVATTGKKGDSLHNKFKFKDGEKVVAGFSLDPRFCGDIGLKPEGEEATSDTDDAEVPPSHLLVVTQNGQGSRVSLAPFYEPSNKSGRRFTRLSKGDQVLDVFIVTGEEMLILASESARYLMFSVEEVKFLSGPGKGVRLMNLDDGDHLFASAVSQSKDQGLTLETENETIIELTPGSIKSAGKRLTKGTQKRGVKGWKRAVPPEIIVPSLKEDTEEDESPDEDEGESEDRELEDTIEAFMQSQQGTLSFK